MKEIKKKIKDKEERIKALRYEQEQLQVKITQHQTIVNVLHNELQKKQGRIEEILETIEELKKQVENIN